ncbi:MAG: EamA family transporter [Gaiellales bacterium]
MAVVLGLVTAFSWAFANVFTQRATRTRTPPAVIMFWVLAVTTAAVFPVALVVDRGAGPWTFAGLAWPIAGGALADVGFFLLLRALTKGSLSVVAPIIALEGGLATLMSVALGERPSGLQYVLLAIAVLGAVLVAVEPGRRTAAGALPAAGAALVYAGVLIALGESQLPALTTVGVTRATSVLVIVPAFLLVRQLPTRANVWPIVWCGILDAVGFAFFAYAAAIGPLSVASVTATQWGTAAALIGIIGMRERLYPNQYAGIAVTLLAVTGLGLLS